MNIEEIAKRNKERLKDKEGFKMISELIEIADENKLNDNDVNDLIDVFEKLGIKISLGTGC